MKRTILAAVVGLFGTGVAFAASPNGTWVGKVRYANEPEIPSTAYPAGKVVVSPTAVVAEFSGLTMATHDPSDARSTCTTQYRFTKEENGWRVFRQKGRTRLSGQVSGGAPDLAPCTLVRSGGAVRLRPAGSKLRVEFADSYRPDDMDASSYGMTGYFRR